MARPPQFCPICGRPAVKQLLDKFRVTAEREGEVRDLAALAAYTCQTEGHIFFVRLCDLDRAHQPANPEPEATKEKPAP